MIKIEKTEVVGWEPTIRGMRNPHNSWDKSDSGWGHDDPDPKTHVYVDEDFEGYNYLTIGPNDQDLMMKLRNAGTDHRKFMRMITVYVDITAPLYWWKEFDTYKVGTVANSCSTMHKIQEKEFTLEDFSCEHIKDLPGMDFRISIEDTINFLNTARAYFLETDKIIKKREENLDQGELADLILQRKDYWWQMIQLLPTSYNQKRTIMLNYEALANMYKSRKGHKLDEWRELCKWIESLPYSELITGGPEFLNKKMNLPDPQDVGRQICWRPIEEFDETKYDWVLVRMSDSYDNFPPVVAEKRTDGKWYDRTDSQLPYEVTAFFDMGLLGEIKDGGMTWY